MILDFGAYYKAIVIKTVALAQTYTHINKTKQIIEIDPHTFDHLIFYKGNRVIYWGRTGVRLFVSDEVAITLSTQIKCTLIPVSHHKNNETLIIDLNIKNKTIKLLGENLYTWG